jgi:type II secretory pathway predicted ATPase ExeA
LSKFERRRHVNERIRTRARAWNGGSLARETAVPEGQLGRGTSVAAGAAMPEGARPLHLRAVSRRQDEAQAPAPAEPTPAMVRAAAAIERALDARAGVIVLLGEAGSGKTALLGRLGDALAARGRTVLRAPLSDDPEAVVAAAVTALGARVEGPGRARRRRLRELVAARGGAVMLVDDAHALAAAALRRLASLASGRGIGPLQLVLAGEAELAVRLRDVAAVAVRVEPLTGAEVGAYVARRFPPADGASTVFTPGALDLIARMSGGVPRAIDALCRASVEHAAAHGEGWVTPGVVLAVWRARESHGQLPEAASPPAPRRRRLGAALLASAAFAMLLVALGRTPRPVPPPAPPRGLPPPASLAAAVSSEPVQGLPPAPRPFPREVAPGQWSIQVAALRDAAAARSARETLARRGLAAVVAPAVVGSTTWHRVLAGRYATRADAERAAATLAPLP